MSTTTRTSTAIITCQHCGGHAVAVIDEDSGYVMSVTCPACGAVVLADDPEELRGGGWRENLADAEQQRREIETDEVSRFNLLMTYSAEVLRTALANHAIHGRSKARTKRDMALMLAVSQIW